MARRKETEEMNMLEEQYMWYRQRVLEARGLASNNSRAINRLPETLALIELAKRYQRRNIGGQRLQGLSPEQIRERRNAQKRESKQRIQRYREERSALLRQFIRSFRMELGEEVNSPSSDDWQRRSAHGPYSQTHSDQMTANDGHTTSSSHPVACLDDASATLSKFGSRPEAPREPPPGSLETLLAYSLNPLESSSGNAYFGERTRNDAANMAIAELDFVAELCRGAHPNDTSSPQLRETDYIVSELLAELNASGPLMSTWDVSLMTTSGMNAIMSETPARGRLLVGVRVFQGLFTCERAANVLGISIDIAQRSLEDLHNNGLLLAIPRASALGSQHAYLVPEHVRRIPPESILELAGDGAESHRKALPQITTPAYDRESASWEAQRILQRVEHNFIQDLRERLGRLEAESRADQPDVWNQIRICFEELQDDFFYAIALAHRHYGIVGVSDLVASFAYCVRYMLKAEARAGIFKNIYEQFEPSLQRYREASRGTSEPLAGLDMAAERSRDSASRCTSSNVVSVEWLHRMHPNCLDPDGGRSEIRSQSDDPAETALGSTMAVAPWPGSGEISLTFTDEVEHAILAGLCLCRAYIDSLCYLEAERILRQLLQVCLRHAPIIPARDKQAQNTSSANRSVASPSPRSFFPNQEVHLLLHPSIHIAIMENLGRLHAHQGRTKSACRCLAQTLVLRRQLGQERSIPYALTLISFGDSLIREHRLETARNAFEEALSILDIHVQRYAERFEFSSRAEALYYLALLHFVAGRNVTALDLLHQGLEVLNTRHHGSFLCCSPRTVLTLEAMIYKLIAQVYIATDRRERALVLLQNALDLISSTYAKGIQTGIHGGSQQQDEHATRELVDALSQLVVDTTKSVTR
jgi:tetratricopeptide (TPR) repeat protein